MSARASIVIPAHNEGARIGALLEALRGPASRGDIAVFVVANGCTDDTVEVASGQREVTVYEIDRAGKTVALNEGDRLAGDLFPRFYCDADVILSWTSLDAMIAALDVEAPAAAGPRVVYSLTGAGWVVRRYYEALSSPIIASWVDRHLVGRGIYGTNRAGRTRFGEFPPLIADDLFFDAQFTDGERVVVEGAVVSVPVPLLTRDLVRRETRVARGNVELHRGNVPAGTTPHLAQRSATLGGRLESLGRWAVQLRTRDVVPLLVYLGVVGWSRVIFRARRGRTLRWR